MSRRTIRSILAATDLGSGSDKIIRSAAVLAERLAAELHLLHVLDPNNLPLPDEVGGTPSFPERVRQAERALAEQPQRVASGIRPTSLRVVGQPVHEAVLTYSAEVSADLIVLGPHRGGKIGAHVLGTTADRVIRESEVPCLVVSTPLALPVRKVGVPIDFSDPARGTLDVALALSTALAGGRGEPAPEIRIFHVGWQVDRVDNPQLEREQIQPALEREVRDAMERLGRPLSSTVQTEVLWGVSPAESITQHAQRAELDLLVLGTHGYSGLKRVLIGSVASGVARSAPCPVLLVPPPLAEHGSGR